MGFHLNSCAYYWRPFESKYAKIRRFLVANDSVPDQVLFHELVNQTPGLKSGAAKITERLDAIEGTDNVISGPTTVTQACPRCAQRLYHSALYEYPWMTLCPIHKCSLTNVCPI